MLELDLLRNFLPSDLLDYFSVTGFEEVFEAHFNHKVFYIDLDENNVMPGGYDPSAYECKDFLPPKHVQDFPIRGKAVILRIRRRRWRHKINKSDIISNDYSFLADGSKLTSELSDFFKDTGREQSRTNQ
jgi:hypothetical protein